MCQKPPVSLQQSCRKSPEKSITGFQANPIKSPFEFRVPNWHGDNIWSAGLRGFPEHQSCWNGFDGQEVWVLEPQLDPSRTGHSRASRRSVRKAILTCHDKNLIKSGETQENRARQTQQHHDTITTSRHNNNAWPGLKHPSQSPVIPLGLTQTNTSFVYSRTGVLYTVCISCSCWPHM